MISLLVVAVLPSPVPVNVDRVQLGYFAEYVEDEGFTSLRFTHAISAPISGYLHRITLEPGDVVAAGDTLLAMESLPAPALDRRARDQARENLEAARARFMAAKAEHENLEHGTSLARKELERHARLYEQGVISLATLDRVRNDLDRSISAQDAAQANVQAAGYEMENARAALEVASGARSGENQLLTVKSPVNAVILNRERYQEGVIHAGEFILEMGRLDELEVQVDLLSIHAVRVRPGMRVILEHWGGPGDLEGKVRLVEPAGFKKVSALGVDEQRVPVLVEITSARDEWLGLGHGYRVEAKFILWEDDQTTFIPTSSLFRLDNNWHVFVVQGERAGLRQVVPGRRSGLNTQILEGLEPGELIITHPGDRIRPGIRVNPESG